MDQFFYSNLSLDIQLSSNLIKSQMIFLSLAGLNNIKLDRCTWRTLQYSVTAAVAVGVLCCIVFYFGVLCCIALCPVVFEGKNLKA